MRILLTGSSSGIGKELKNILKDQHDVDCPTRQQLDLRKFSSVISYINKPYDMLINCAGTGIGGKIEFVDHDVGCLDEILQVNFVNVVLLTHQALKLNPSCKIVNITSTNNKHYWPNDLGYSLSKKCLELFGNMLCIEYPTLSYLEVRVGLTKTNFNNNRYQNYQERFIDIYEKNKHLSADDVARKIADAMFDDRIKFIEISP